MDAHKEGWSRIASHLGYRVVDVSSFKEIAARWYPTLPLKSKKTSKHRYVKYRNLNHTNALIAH